MSFTLNKNQKTYNFNNELNQLFRPTSKFGIEKVDYIETDLLSSNKFDQILIQEIIGLLKTQNYARLSINVDKFKPNSLDYLRSNFNKKYLNLYLIKKNQKINSQNLKKFNENKILDNYDLVIKKKNSLKEILGDSDKWTFGIVTNGSRDKELKEILNSIKKLNISFLDIIICGKTNLNLDKKINYIKFTQKDELGWITKKKNLIVKNSKYDNIVIIHDRIIFNKNFLKGFTKWGNYFFHITIQQKYKKKRVHDWVVNAKYKKNDLSFLSLLDYRDWDPNVVISGQIHIGKKYVFQKIKWNNDLFWGHSEDVELSDRIHKYGFLNRFNPFSSCNVLFTRFDYLPIIKFDKNKLSKIQFGPLIIIFGRKIYKIMHKYKYLRKLSLKIYELINIKTNIFK